MTKTNRDTLRLRIFAGPNGSGKSTVINSVKNQKVNDYLIDFGIYINADEIKKNLDNNTFAFNSYEIRKVNVEVLIDIVEKSGLINKKFTINQFSESFILKENKCILLDKYRADALAQILADFIRKQLLQDRKKFSFETVFSHESKLEIMRKAAEAGYKVYLYFVATENPFINVGRVKFRVSQGGHDVPEDKIISRYFKSLELMHDAAQLAYQAYFFDNSGDDGEPKMFAHFKVENGKKKWDPLQKEDLPIWFQTFYLNKVKP